MIAVESGLVTSLTSIIRPTKVEKISSIQFSYRSSRFRVFVTLVF